MNKIVTEKIIALTMQYDAISSERKAVLEKIAQCIKEMKASGSEVNLLYVCTHNSRRSHFGQVAAALAAAFYGITNMHSFSAGTEVTAMNHNAVNALTAFGCEVLKEGDSNNPNYRVSFGAETDVVCFSKRYNDITIPKQHIIAIMTCTDAEQNCPFIPAARYRISTPYADPKQSDGSGQEAQIYYERLMQILTETLYVFHFYNHFL